MQTVVEEVIRDVRSVMDPVASRLELRGPTVIRKIMYVALGYFGDNLGVEVFLELDHFFVLLMLFRANKEGSIPVGYADLSGRVHKVYLQDALDRLGVDYEDAERRLKSLGGDYRNGRHMISILSALLEENWELLVAHPERLWFQ